MKNIVKKTIKFKNNKKFQTSIMIFYSKKIKIKDFQDALVKYATDDTVKKILKSKNKATFTKLINSPRWDLYSGNISRRGRVRYHDNFTPATAIITNFCIQNEIDV